MDFAIQVSNPKSTGCISETDETLAEAIESLFPLHTEYAFLIWDNVYVPLSYKYDVSLINEDVVLMIELLSQSPNGHTTIHWPSNSFLAKWEVSWSEDTVTVEAIWESVIGGTESLLNASPKIAVEKKAFIAEWG